MRVSNSVLGTVNSDGPGFWFTSIMRAVKTHPKERGERTEQLNHAMHLPERLGYTY